MGARKCGGNTGVNGLPPGSPRMLSSWPICRHSFGDYGVLGDVFAVVSAELPEWTRARWEQASAELAAAHARRAEEREPHRLDECSPLDTLQGRERDGIGCHVHAWADA